MSRRHIVRREVSRIRSFIGDVSLEPLDRGCGVTPEALAKKMRTLFPA
jgi:hypothetical protein